MAERARQPRELLLAGEGEHRQPRPADDVGAGQQPLHHRPHGGGAEHQRLFARAHVEHAIGEDVAALEIGAELDLVDGEEGDVEVARHGLDGGDPEARVGRLDLLLAGDQRDRSAPTRSTHFVVDLAREQPQRQTDHAARMRQHPLDREVGLAGVGRAEHRGDAGAAGARGRDWAAGKRRLPLRVRPGGGSVTLHRRLLYHNATTESRAVKL